MFFSFSQNPGKDNTLVPPLLSSRPLLPEMQRTMADTASIWYIIGKLSPHSSVFKFF
jgi:hypothetical protein